MKQSEVNPLFLVNIHQTLPCCDLRQKYCSVSCLIFSFLIVIRVLGGWGILNIPLASLGP